MSEPAVRHYEDIAVGDRAAFGRYAVTREEVIAFASRYDPQPFHLPMKRQPPRISAGWRQADGIAAQ
jgi:hypothetical protein